MNCNRCGCPIGQDAGPPGGWTLENGEVVCHACCVKDTKLVVATVTPAQREAFRKEWESRYRGPGNLDRKTKQRIASSVLFGLAIVLLGMLLRWLAVEYSPYR